MEFPMLQAVFSQPSHPNYQIAVTSDYQSAPKYRGQSWTVAGDAWPTGYQGEAQPSVTPSPSAPPSASPQPSSSKTITKEPSVVLPVSQDTGSDTQSTTSESSSESSSGTSSSSEVSSTMTSPSTGTTSSSSSASTSPEMLEMERSFETIFNQECDKLGRAITCGTLIGAKQCIKVMQRAIKEQQRPRPVSAPPVASQPLPPLPRRRLSDTGSKSKVQAGNATAHRTSTPETSDRLQNINEEPRHRIGPSRVRELAKYFTPPSNEDVPTHINTRTRRKKLFPPKWTLDITRSFQDQV